MTVKEFFKQKFKPSAQRFLNAAWDYIKAAKIELIILFAFLIIDLVSKQILAAVMPESERVTVIPNFFHIYYAKNTKAAFGSAFGLEKVMSEAALRTMFLIITVPAIGVFSYFMYRFRNGPKLSRICFALIIAGALGNFFDRLFLRYVRDFFEIEFFGFDVPLLGESFAIFNIADAALVAGVIMFAVYFIFIYKTPKPQFTGPIQMFLGEDGVYRLKDNSKEAEKTKVNDKKAAKKQKAE